MVGPLDSRALHLALVDTRRHDVFATLGNLRGLEHHMTLIVPLFVGFFMCRGGSLLTSPFGPFNGHGLFEFVSADA